MLLLNRSLPPSLPFCSGRRGVSEQRAAVAGQRASHGFGAHRHSTEHALEPAGPTQVGPADGWMFGLETFRNAQPGCI